MYGRVPPGSWYRGIHALASRGPPSLELTSTRLNRRVRLVSLSMNKKFKRPTRGFGGAENDVYVLEVLSFDSEIKLHV